MDIRTIRMSCILVRLRQHVCGCGGLIVIFGYLEVWITSYTFLLCVIFPVRSSVYILFTLNVSNNGGMYAPSGNKKNSKLFSA